MRIAFVAGALDVGGAERQLVELARGFAARGHEISVHLFRGGGGLEGELDGIPIHVIGKRGRWDLAAFSARLAAALRAEAPDIIYSFLPVPNVFVALLKPVLPGVRLVWAIRASDRDRIPLDWANRVAYGLEARLSAIPDRILANSQAGFNVGRRRGISGARMQVVPNGFDIARFREDPAGRARVRAELCLAPTSFAIGLVARLDPIKDHATFLRAAALAARKNRDLRVVLVGDGPPDYRDELELLGRRIGLDVVIWAGRRTDMPAVYSALDGVCLSSLSEGFPNVVAEAMACGRPCVVTDVGDAANIVGDTGVVVPAGDADALARGMLDLIARPRQDTRKRIVEVFGMDALISRTLAIFAELLQPAGTAVAARGM